MNVISFKIKEEKYIEQLAMAGYLLMRKPDLTEQLLIHFIKESIYDPYHRYNVYYNGSGKRCIARKALGDITANQYRKAFNAILQTGTIAKMKDGGKGNLCYFRFSATLNDWIKKINNEVKI